MTKIPKKFLKLINDDPIILSCLYDLNLLPEQINQQDKTQVRQMLLIASHIKQARDTAQEKYNILIATLKELKKFFDYFSDNSHREPKESEGDDGCKIINTVPTICVGEKWFDKCRKTIQDTLKIVK